MCIVQKQFSLINRCQCFIQLCCAKFQVWVIMPVYSATHSFPQRHLAVECLSLPKPVSIFLMLWFAVCRTKYSINHKEQRKTSMWPQKSDDACSDYSYDMELPFGFRLLKRHFCELKPLNRPLQYLWKDSSTTKQIINASTYYTKMYQCTSKEAIRHTHNCPITESSHDSWPYTEHQPRSPIHSMHTADNLQNSRLRDPSSTCLKRVDGSVWESMKN